jgi:lipopolysaccharide assembly protein A
MMRIFLIIVLVVALVIGIAVGYFNAQSVHFNFLFGEVELPLIALLIADFLFAALLTLLVTSARMFGYATEIRRLRQQLRDTDTELKSLRNLPLSPDAR